MEPGQLQFTNVGKNNSTETYSSNSTIKPLSGEDFELLSRFIQQNYGIKMPPAKKVMLEARLMKRLRTLEMKDFAEYCRFLFSPEGLERELISMIDVITTNKTDFFREPVHFDYLLNTICPQFENAELSIWSAGCSTGEEPYTISMVLSEFGERHPGFRYSITASDISSQVLEKAVLAIYPEEKTSPLPAVYKHKYLLRSKDRGAGQVRIKPEVRRKINFYRFNLMADSFTCMRSHDVIFCRNVIIYFDRPTQGKLIMNLAGKLNKGGYLFLGHSETLCNMKIPLVSVAPTIYRKE
jgi:chemotaxis protein methyltransferase CheR